MPLSEWRDKEIGPEHEGKILLVLTVMIGAVIGLVVVAFIVVTENLGARMYPANAQAWRRISIPAFGSLVAGYLLWRYFPDARGSGIPQTKAALFLNNGIIRFKTAAGKFACCALTLASGVALGREGPSVQIAAGIGSTLGRRLGLSPRSIRALVPISAAAALAAAFNTPIAAVFFTLEEILGDLHAPVLGSIALSSATSWTVLHLLLGDEPLFHVPAYELVHPLEFIFYAVLGVAGGFVSVGFVKLLLWLRRYFQSLPRRTMWVQPLAGGLLVGAMGWFVPEVLGVGYGYIGRALNGEVLITTMALLVLLKVAATATCYASGNSGGIFGPTLFIGGMLGGAFGGVAHLLLPDYTGSIGAYALVGMGTVFAGVIRVPLTSVIMIFEVTRDYTIVVPLMISNLTAYYISSKYQEEPIYEALQHQDGIYLPGGARDREEPLVVARGAHPPGVVFSAGESIESALARVPANEEAWPVVDESGLLGMVTLDRLLNVAAMDCGGERVDSLSSQADALTHSIFEDESLDTAMRRMAQTGMKTLPVVSRSNLRKLVAVITLNDVLTAYGLVKGEQAPAEAKTVSPAAVSNLTRIAIALGLAIGLSGFLAYYYRAERSSQAQREFQEGAKLAADGRYEDAIMKFRGAIATSHSDVHRRALAAALTEAGHLAEAQSILDALLREHPNDGPANLGMARTMAKAGKIPLAIRDYHRAIYGAWTGAAPQDRAEARRELVALLDHDGEHDQARAEMMAWKNDTPGDPDPYAGLGEADLGAGNFAAALSEYREAARRAPSNSFYRDRVRLLQDIDSMNPTLRAHDRTAASLNLLRQAARSLDRCLAAQNGTDEAHDLQKQADKRLRSNTVGNTTQNTSFALQLWTARMGVCGRGGPEDEALNRVVSQLR
jgi:CIC family chloride channel protein